MKFLPVGTTTIAWSTFLKEMPQELVDACNRFNIQSVNGYLHLLSLYDHRRKVLDNKIQPYLLNLWHWTFYFNLPYDVITELLLKTNLKAVSVPEGTKSAAYESGLLVGSLKDWFDFASLRDKPYVTRELATLSNVVFGLFSRENLSYLFEQES